MNRKYRRNKLKEQRRKLKEDKMLREISSNLCRVFTKFIQNDFKEKSYG